MSSEHLKFATLVIHPIEAHAEGIAVARIVAVERQKAKEIGFEVSGYVGLTKLGMRSQTDARVLS